jgi:hypothetical protein
MNETRQTMEGPEGGETFESTRALFQRWRESRQRGARIPKALWAAAVEMARQYGVVQTAQRLHVDGPRLLKRMEGAGFARAADPHTVTFVALSRSTPAARTGIAECVVEIQNARGGTMRVSLQGSGLTQLAPLCAAFWGAP